MASEAHSEDPEALWRQAEAHLAQAEPRLALPLARKVAQLAPDHDHAHRFLAGFANSRGDREVGQGLMRRFYARNPLGPLRGTSSPGRALLLILRGFHDTEAKLLKSRETGDYAVIERGGHFTTTYLMQGADQPRRSFTIAQENLLQPNVVPPHGLMLNSIADPDLEAPSLACLERYLVDHPKTVVLNKPERVRLTARDQNYQRFRGWNGIEFPPTFRVMFRTVGAEAVTQTIAHLGLQGPVILRRTGTQTGRTTVLLPDAQAVRTHVEQNRNGVLDGEYYLIAYREHRVLDGLFRKLRLFWIKDRFFPVVCHLDRVWNVHGGNRKTVMRDNEALMAEEKRFLASWQDYVGPANVVRLERIAAEVDLDFWSIDFTITDAGDVLIYELNPAVRHSFDHGNNFPYKLPYDYAITEAFTKMVWC
ncbi:MAG: tetratricopeptide repeat protein [Rhodospirillaceae bacterium]